MPCHSSRTALFLVAHGSYDPRPAIALKQLQDRLGQYLIGSGHLVAENHLGLGFLDCTPIPLEAQLCQFMQGLEPGVDRMMVVPLFLLPGIHVSEDIPQAIARAQAQSSMPLELLPFLGSWPPFQNLVQSHLKSPPAWIVIAHGSRRPQAKDWLEKLSQTWDVTLALWSEPASLEQAIQTIITQEPEHPLNTIAIFPYLLFAGKTIAAIAQELIHLQALYSQVSLQLHSGFEINAAFVNCVAEFLIQRLRGIQSRAESPVNLLGVE